MSTNNDVSINVPILARVEGEGALELQIKNKKITSLRLKIYEPPRLFEKFLEKRNYGDVLDFVARICGICPVAYQMSAAHALESCFGIRTSPWIRQMRRLFYCGEWLESHSMHIHFLALPDFLGFHTATEMAKAYPEEVRRGIRLQSFGNELIRLFGGRSVHPVGACVGGFYRAPSLQEISALLKIANERLDDCTQLLNSLAKLKLPDYSHDFTSVSLYHPMEYPFNEGRIVSDHGLNIEINQFNQYFNEFQVPYSNALHCILKGKPYLVGPLARVNNCLGHLPHEIHAHLQRIGIQFPSKNMYHSIFARAVEIYFCVLEAIRIMENYSYPDQSYMDCQPKKGEGFGCTEAPRGLLWQHYKVDEHGNIEFARIVPPTSQNQARIEEDLRITVEQFGLDKSEEDLRSFSETIIRNYDPCISCSTHFIQLKVDRI